MKRLLFIIAMIISFVQVDAQCAMCTKTAQGLNEDAAKDINVAILYLAFIPFAFLIAILYYVYRSRRANV
jgi:hypothetical protein